MGSGTFNPSAYAATASTYASMPASAIFSHSMKANLNPHGVTCRESRDSVDNPQSTPLIVGSDVTGSMSHLAEAIAKGSVGVLFNEVFDRKPITDPHVMFMAIGDVGDSAPLQVTQFEADNRIVEQLVDTYIEKGGSGPEHGHEAYLLAWYFAGMHTSHDSFEKRGKKGYLFTVGDEGPLSVLTPYSIKKIFDDDVGEDMTAEQLLTMAQKTFHVFHLVVKESGYGLRYLPEWRNLLGENALVLTDHTKLAEVIVSTMQVIEGASVDSVTKSWSGDTSLVVATAINGLTTVKGGKATQVKRF